MIAIAAGDFDAVDNADLVRFRAALSIRGARSELITKPMAGECIVAHLLCLLTTNAFSQRLGAILARTIRDCKRKKIGISFIALNTEQDDVFLGKLASSAMVRAGIKLMDFPMVEVARLEFETAQLLPLRACFPFPHLQMQCNSNNDDAEMLGTYTFTEQSPCLLFAIQNLYCQFAARGVRLEEEEGDALGNVLDFCLAHEGDLLLLFQNLIARRFDLGNVVITLENANACRQQEELHRLASQHKQQVVLHYETAPPTSPRSLEQDVWEITYANLLSRVKRAVQTGTYFNLTQGLRARDAVVCDLLQLSKRALMHDPDQLLAQILGRMGTQCSSSSSPHALVLECRALAYGNPNPAYKFTSFPLEHFSGLQRVARLYEQTYLHSVPVYAAEFVDEHGGVLTACWDGNLRLFDKESGEVKRVIPCSSSSNGSGSALLCLDSCRELIAVGCADGSILLLAKQDLTIVRVLRGANQRINALAFYQQKHPRAGEESLEDYVLFSGSQDGTVRRWERGVCTWCVTLGDAISSLLVVVCPPNEDGGREPVLYVSCCNFLITAYGIGDGEASLNQLDCFASGHSGEITAMAYDEDHQVLFTASSDGMVRLFYKHVFARQIDCNDQPITSLALSFPLLYIGTDRVRVFDLQKFDHQGVLLDSPFVISHVKLDCGKQKLLVTSENARCKLFSLNKPFGLCSRQTQMITAVAVSARQAITTSLDYNLAVWDLTTGEQTDTLRGHRDVICSISLNDHGVAASSSLDHTCRVWRVDNGDAQVLAVITHDGPVLNCLVSNHSRRHPLIITMGEESAGPRFFTKKGRELARADVVTKYGQDLPSLFDLPQLANEHDLEFDLDLERRQHLGQVRRRGNVVFAPVEDTFLVWIVITT